MSGSSTAVAARVTVGLDPVVPNNPSITFVFFVAMVMLLVLSARFAYYAYLNGRVPGQANLRSIWLGLAVAGMAAAVYALLGLVDVTTSLSTPFRRGVFFGHVVAMAFVVQRLCRQTLPVDESAWWAAPSDGLWVGGLAVAVLVSLGTAVAAAHPVVVLLEGLGALAFAALGFAGGREGLATTRVQGTIVDTLLRHLLPVLAFATAIPLLELASFGVDRVVVLHIQVVFVVVTATTLMTATIRLRQNLAGL